MTRMIALLLVVVLLPFLGGCSSTPGSGGASANSTPVATTAAQDVGRDQSSAQAAETGSASSSINPSIVNILAAKKVMITRKPNGEETVEVDGSDDSEVSISNGKLGTFDMGDDTALEAQISSGSAQGAGGSTATGRGGNSAGGDGQ